MSNLKSGGDAANIAAANTQSGVADAAGVGVAPAVLGGLGLGAGFGGAVTGDAATGQAQGASGGDVTDNTSLGDINISV